jgi:filamentous hemagglutinin family protein
MKKPVHRVLAFSMLCQALHAAAAAFRQVTPTVLVLMGITTVTPSIAGPQDGTVTAGSATITATSATRTDISQQTDRAVVDWRQFNIAANEHVNFSQPTSQSVILNRVTGDDASQIMGRLTANGQVFLLNPNGILFGKNSVVNLGGLVASVANITNADFMAGRLQFSPSGKPGAQVRNEGQITLSDSGVLAFVAPHVENTGIITARLGKVTLAGGTAFTLDLYGDQLVNLVLDRAALDSLTDAQGKPLSILVDQSGSILAEGGRVNLTTISAKQVVDNLVNLSGVIKATGVSATKGVITLTGGGAVNLSGTLDASGLEAGQRGGLVVLSGTSVSLSATARINASGDQGGGAVVIGGAPIAEGLLTRADSTQQKWKSVGRGTDIDAGAIITANAITNGNGGTVALLAPTGSGRYIGRIEAKGGAMNGNGGEVSFSALGSIFPLLSEAKIDVSAPHGISGKVTSESGLTGIPTTPTLENWGKEDSNTHLITPVYKQGNSTSLANSLNAALGDKEADRRPSIVQGRSISDYADFGRRSPSSGSAVNVFDQTFSIAGAENTALADSVYFVPMSIRSISAEGDPQRKP